MNSVMKMKIVRRGGRGGPKPQQKIPGHGGHGSLGPVIIDTKEMIYTIDFLLIAFCSAKCWPIDVFVPIWVERNLFFGEEGTF